MVQKQREGFTALINGLRGSATIKLYTPEGVISSKPPASMDSFAACVGRKATVYGVSWSESFIEQQEMFKSSTSLLTTVNCDEKPSLCNEAGVQKYPTWVIDGELYGKMSLAEIAEKTDCELKA
jgi:hypothetical protein